MKKSTLQRWQDRQKGRAIRLLKELTKRIEKEELIVNDAGFWLSPGSNEMIFRFITISRHSEQDSSDFRLLS